MSEQVIEDLMARLEILKAENERLNKRLADHEQSGEFKNVGQCSRCDHLIYAREHCPKCRSGDEVTHPMFQHTSRELRHVADMLELLNNPPEDIDGTGFVGSIDLYWCDRVMGTVYMDEEGDRQSWVYSPKAKA